uniref:Lipase domain-containing protein n=1 Tax=Glossina brevipalpis TaxID=37001 RepID=A0A1A9WQ29_9MUSC
MQFIFRLLITLLSWLVAITANSFNNDLKDKIEFFVYTKQSSDNSMPLEVNVESIVRSGIDLQKPTTFAIHGVFDSENFEEYEVIRDTKFEIEDDNVIVVDYRYLTYYFFPDLRNASTIASIVTDSITELFVLLHNTFDLDFKRVHVVGFCLGGQIAGFLGQRIYDNFNMKIGRITALDPFGLLYFSSTPDNERLSPDDAEYVEVIHTNAGEFGFKSPCGHADYYPNGGTTQPGCNQMHCSHKRAYELVPNMWLPITEHEFIVSKCGSHVNIQPEYCRWLNIRMGDLQQQPLPMGVFYVETIAKEPFVDANLLSEEPSRFKDALNIICSASLSGLLFNNKDVMGVVFANTDKNPELYEPNYLEGIEIPDSCAVFLPVRQLTKAIVDHYLRLLEILMENFVQTYGVVRNGNETNFLICSACTWI